MARYIDADKFLEAQKDRCEGKVLIGNCTSNNNYLEYELEKYIEEDVQPVVHSKWEISSDGYYPYCKRCKARPLEMTKYCPECGARMDGD